MRLRLVRLSLFLSIGCSNVGGPIRRVCEPGMPVAKTVGLACPWHDGSIDWQFLPIPPDFCSADHHPRSKKPGIAGRLMGRCSRQGLLHLGSVPGGIPGWQTQRAGCMNDLYPVPVIISRLIQSTT